MSAYPEWWEIGDTRARNLVPRPRFDSSKDRGLWSAGVIAESSTSGLDGGYAYRLLVSTASSNSTLTSIPLLDTYEPGAEFDVMIHYAYAEETIPLYVYVADKRHAVEHIPETHKAQLPTTPDRFTFTTEIVRVKTPEDTYRDDRGDLFTPATLDLCVDGRGNATYFSFTRVDYPDSDIVGYFDGDTEDTAELAHGWTGDPLVSASTALALTAGGEAPDPEPDPDPEPEPGETTAIGRRVAAFLGQSGNEGLEQLATQHAAVIAAMAESYTRGRGFVDGEPAAPIAAVIVTATARLLGNPQQTARQIGDVSYRGGFAGWSLAELYVLNNYRKRQA